MSEGGPHNAVFVVWVTGRMLHEVIPSLALPVLYVPTPAKNRLEWATNQPKSPFASESKRVSS